MTGGLPLFAAALAAALLYPAGEARAYVDPGTGSIILQVLLGGAAGAMVIGRLYWERIKAFFTGPSSDDTDKPEVEQDR